MSLAAVRAWSQRAGFLHGGTEAVWISFIIWTKPLKAAGGVGHYHTQAVVASCGGREPYGGKVSTPSGQEGAAVRVGKWCKGAKTSARKKSDGVLKWGEARGEQWLKLTFTRKTT